MADRTIPRKRAARVRDWTIVVLVVVAVVLAAGVLAGAGRVQPGGANDRAAQSNLTNALTEVASDLPTHGPTYAFATPGFLDRTAPEFDWIADGPTLGARFQAVGIDRCADGTTCRSFVLAAFNRTTRVCWYAVTADTAAAAAALGLPGPGTFYGSRPHPQTCSAGTPGHPTRPPSGWQVSYSAASPSG